jgi:PASTA domain
MKGNIELLAAIIGLAAAVIALLGGLNRNGTVDVPVIREIKVFQPPPPSPQPPPGPTPTTDGTKISVPDIRGLAQAEAEKKIVDIGLTDHVVYVAKPLCTQDSGVAEETNPPAGFTVSEGTNVELIVCE